MDYGFNIALNMYRNLTGDYDTSFSTTEEIYNAIDVSIPSGTPVVISPLSVSIKENGTHIYETELGIDGYNPITVEVDVPTGGSGGEGFDFTVLGYGTKFDDIDDIPYNETVNSSIQSDIRYSKYILDNWDPSSTRASFSTDNKLVYCPMIDTSNLTSMRTMFYECPSLQFIPNLNTSNVIDMANTFYGCGALQFVGPMDTSKVENMRDLFHGCKSLSVRAEMDAGFVTDTSRMFSGCESLTDFYGLTDFGKQPELTTTNMFSLCNNLTHDSIMCIIYGLYDRKTAGYSVVDLPLGEENLARISDVEKAIAINKGWILS
jgi:surface protein